MSTPFSPAITTFSSRMETTIIKGKTPATSPSMTARKVIDSVPPPLDLDGVASSEQTPKLLPEPLLSDADERLVLFPIKHADV